MGLNSANLPTLTIPNGLTINKQNATVSVRFSNLRLTDCGTAPCKTFFLLKLLNSPLKASSGHCLYISGNDLDTVTLQNVEVSNSGKPNDVSAGGALYLMAKNISTVTMDKCTFSNNFADVGGAVFIGGTGSIFFLVPLHRSDFFLSNSFTSRFGCHQFGLSLK